MKVSVKKAFNMSPLIENVGFLLLFFYIYICMHVMKPMIMTTVAKCCCLAFANLRF